MVMNALITGWGFYVPPKVLTNADLEALVHTTDAWIYERTGIRERHIVEGDEVTSVMGDVLRCNELQVWFIAEHLVDVPLVEH